MPSRRPAWRTRSPKHVPGESWTNAVATIKFKENTLKRTGNGEDVQRYVQHHASIVRVIRWPNVIIFCFRFHVCRIYVLVKNLAVISSTRSKTLTAFKDLWTCTTTKQDEGCVLGKYFTIKLYKVYKVHWLFYGIKGILTRSNFLKCKFFFFVAVGWTNRITKLFSIYSLI